MQAWVDALNSGDVDAALALFTDDLKFDVFEYHARNKDELRGIFDWLAGLETKYQIKECQTKEDRVVCTMPVSDACIAGYDPRWPDVEDDICFHTGWQDLASVGKPGVRRWGLLCRMDLAWDDLDAGQPRRGAAKAESTSDGREAGAIQAKLCKEYGESLKATPT